MMRLKQKLVVLSAVFFFLAGCAPVIQRAMVTDGTISNPSLGIFGFRFNIPDSLELYSPVVIADRNELQQMAVRVYDFTEKYHPRGNERFCESFLLLSEHACFLLVTVQYDPASASVEGWDDTGLTDFNAPVFPFYNVSQTGSVRLNEDRTDAVCVRGQAYEKNGWIYSHPGRGRTEFYYEACQANGTDRDTYILVGITLPEYADELSAQMDPLMASLRF